jgi:hypothetical protein
MTWLAWDTLRCSGAESLPHARISPTPRRPERSQVRTPATRPTWPRSVGPRGLRQPIPAVEKVRSPRDGVAVAAESCDCRRGRGTGDAEYDPMPAVFDAGSLKPSAGRSRGAMVLCGAAQPRSTREPDRSPSTAGGDVEAAPAASDRVFDHTFSTSSASRYLSHTRARLSPTTPSKSGRATSPLPVA